MRVRDLKNSLLATWRLVRRAGDKISPSTTYSDGVCARDGDRILYRAGGRPDPSTPQWPAWSPTRTYYATPDHVVAIERDLWRYPDGTIARDGPRFYAPDQPMVPVIDLGGPAAKKSISAAKRRHRRSKPVESTTPRAPRARGPGNPALRTPAQFRPRALNAACRRSP